MTPLSLQQPPTYILPSATCLYSSMPPLTSVESNSFKVLPLPETPPLTPGLECCMPRTPRKPLNPRQTVPSVDRSTSAIISFKMVQNGSELSPSLKITSVAPLKRRISTARRRLWVQQGQTCEPFTLDSLDTKVEVLKDYHHHPQTTPYLDGGDADDEMEGNSPVSCCSPPYSPGYEDAASETAAKPASSSYPYSTLNKEKRLGQFLNSPKNRVTTPTTTTKTKTCASCKTKKTPLWRDSEDGTPYCNACGIRFKKYRFRCSSCSYIPRKDEREVSKLCCVCGSRLVHCKISGRY